MPKKKLVLTFPPSLLNQPVTYSLVKDYGIKINILRARVTPEEEGKLVLEMEGKEDKLREGMKFLESMGVKMESLTMDVRWNPDKCTHCTACIPVCPTGALRVDRTTWEVSFQREKCILCELCVPSCPYKAMEVLI